METMVVVGVLGAVCLLSNAVNAYFVYWYLRHQGMKSVAVEKAQIQAEVEKKELDVASERPMRKFGGRI